MARYDTAAMRSKTQQAADAGDRLAKMLLEIRDTALSANIVGGAFWPSLQRKIGELDEFSTRLKNAGFGTREAAYSDAEKMDAAQNQTIK